MHVVCFLLHGKPCAYLIDSICSGEERAHRARWLSSGGRGERAGEIGVHLLNTANILGS